MTYIHIVTNIHAIIKIVFSPQCIDYPNIKYSIQNAAIIANPFFLLEAINAKLIKNNPA